MYMNYITDILNLKKPKWYQFRLIGKNRRIIKKAEFYIETMSERSMKRVTDFVDNCCDFMTTIEYLRENGFKDDNIIPAYMQNVKFSSKKNHEYVSIDFFSVEFIANDYNINIYLKKSIGRSAWDIRGISIDYISSNKNISQSLDFRNIYTLNLSEINGEQKIIINLVIDFIRNVLMHTIKSLIYVYQ